MSIPLPMLVEMNPHLNGDRSLKSIFRPYRLLCVDDNLAFLGLLGAVLDTYGYEVIIASDAIDAIIECDMYSGSFDAIISDYSMPNMSGVEFVAKLRLKGYRGPILIMSGNMNDDVKMEFEAYNISHFYRKPFRIRQIAIDLSFFSHKRNRTRRIYSSV